MRVSGELEVQLGFWYIFNVDGFQLFFHESIFFIMYIKAKT